MMTWLALMIVAGLDATAPTADHTDEVLAMAPAQADVFVYVDAEALVQPSWRYLRTGLLAEPIVANSPELKGQIAEATASIELVLADAAAKVGMHPVDDIDRIALWLELREVQGDTPVDFGLTVVVWGEFETGTLDQIAATAGWESNTGPSGPTTYRSTVDGLTLHVAQLADDKVVIATEPELMAHVEGTFQAAARPDGSALALQATRLEAGAIAMLSVTPGKPMATLLAEGADGSTSAHEMLTGFTQLHVALHVDGLDLDLEATSAAMAARYELFAQGLTDVLEAGRAGARGLARLALASLSKDDPDFDELRPLLQDSDATLAFVERFTGTTALQIKNGSRADASRVAFEVRAGHLRQVLLPLTLAAAATVF